jgi:phospholipase C
MRTQTSSHTKFKQRLCSFVALSAVLANAMAPSVAFAESAKETARTPIKHVIYIIGENRSFDHVFATYQPVNAKEKVLNLLSEGIVQGNGLPGPNYSKAAQAQASVTTTYQSAPGQKSLYSVLPPALTGGPSSPYICQGVGDTGESCVTAANIALAQTLETGLPNDYAQYLLTGGTGQASHVPDARVSYAGQDASHLPNGPYQLTNANYPYDSYAASPVHRLFQMWQQLDCSADAAQKNHDFGCRMDLFPWVEVTVGAGKNGAARPANYSDTTTGEGSTSMGFYNVQKGDAPYLKQLADQYTLSDNYHQAGTGGTGLNHILLGYADALWFSDGAGKPLVPPSNTVNPAAPGTTASGASALSEIENPNPQPGTNNWYVQDGYGGGSGSPTAVSPNANYGGGSYVACADASQPGVAPVLDYLKGLRRPVSSRCEPGHYYLVNNYNPGYFGDGSNAYTDTNSNNYVYTIPPTTVRSIGDALNDHNITWAYFGDHYDRYLEDKYQLNWNSGLDQYCNICNWAQYSSRIMTDPNQRAAHLKDTSDLYAGIAAGNLPAVSYVKPSGLVDGHPASSKLNLYEGFVKKVVDAVKANPALWDNTAIFVTVDEGGGYWDSGYVQPLDFFGDGTRIPMIVVSKYTTGGHINHTYNDHVSFDKFIEANWGLPPITERSRDNLPNPKVEENNPYIPTNSPALGDMMDMFHFPKSDADKG